MSDFQIPRTAKTRPLTILAQDPSVFDRNDEPLLTSVDIPAEELAPGPSGYRVRVIDYDASTGALYQPLREDSNLSGFIDQFEGKPFEKLHGDPQFHQQNVYAIVMRILGRFEIALGRRLSWQFDSHQLKVVPHAFREANAFYSREHEALLFGYYACQTKVKKLKQKSHSKHHIYTCLSHDIVAHETAHALLDGIRERFIYPSIPDQAAFHEGFADLVAILSVLSVPELVEEILVNEENHEVSICTDESDREFRSESIEQLSSEIDLIAPLLSLAEQMGSTFGNSRSQALRESLKIVPDKASLKKPEFQQAHRRGELLVAAVMRAVLKIAKRRALAVGIEDDKEGESCRMVSAKQLAICFAKAASDVLNICIRGLDYLVPVHVTFNDYLAAILTADFELVGNDSKFRYRQVLLESFQEYGIGSISDNRRGLHEQVDDTRWLRNERTDHHAMMFNPDEMFRYIWENREPLGISDNYYTQVTAVNPTIRVGPGGTMVSETVVEYVQIAVLRADELRQHGLRRARSMPVDCKIKLYGGGTLIFDVRGKLKYHIRNHLDDPSFQNPVIRHLWKTDQINLANIKDHSHLSFASMHEQRSLRTQKNGTGSEKWQ